MMREFAKAVGCILLGAVVIVVVAAIAAGFAWFWFTSAKLVGPWVFVLPLAAIASWAVGDAVAARAKKWF